VTRAAPGEQHVKATYPWDEAWSTCMDVVSRAEAADLVERTAEWITTVVDGRSACYGWSGGKDSQALRVVCERAGVPDCVCCITELEYPACLAWLEAHRPPGCTFWNSGIDAAYVAARPGWLFPQAGTRQVGAWMARHQWRGERLFQQRGYDVMLLGRRRADGNVAPPVSHLKGVGLRANPLARWSNMQALAVIRHFADGLPPIYGWPRGWFYGLSAWARREYNREEDGWRDLWRDDPSLLYEAAETFPGAATMLATLAP
jgi:hypothetical protein